MRIVGLLGDGRVAIGGRRPRGLSDRGSSAGLQAGLKLSCGVASGGDMRLAMDGSLIMVIDAIGAHEKCG